MVETSRNLKIDIGKKRASLDNLSPLSRPMSSGGASNRSNTSAQRKAAARLERMIPTPNDFQGRLNTLIIIQKYYLGSFVRDHSEGIKKRKELGNIEYETEKRDLVFKWSDDAKFLKSDSLIMSTDLYMGEMDEDDLPHGRGVRISKYGGLFEGHFIDGERHGKGRLIHCTGQVFEGEYFENLEHGQGWMTYPKLEEKGLDAGSQINGLWEHGELVEYIWYDKDGNVIE